LARSIPLLVKCGYTIADQSLVQQNTHALQVVPSVASDSLTTLELDHVEALHDLVMVQLAKSRTVHFHLFVWFSKSAHNFVVVFGFGDDAVGRHDIADLVEGLFLFRHDFNCDPLLLGDLLIDRFGMSDFFFAFVLALARCFLVLHDF
jgi:hypothetical protein